jgi:phospholipid N-methyltransferase
LSPTGRFLQYQYALQNLGDVRRYFDISHISFELLNFWPAFIYLARKK